jgi:hypothetical protein
MCASQFAIYRLYNNNLDKIIINKFLEFVKNEDFKSFSTQVANFQKCEKCSSSKNLIIIEICNHIICESCVHKDVCNICNIKYLCWHKYNIVNINLYTHFIEIAILLQKFDFIICNLKEIVAISLVDIFHCFRAVQCILHNIKDDDNDKDTCNDNKDICNDNKDTCKDIFIKCTQILKLILEKSPQNIKVDYDMYPSKVQEIKNTVTKQTIYTTLFGYKFFYDTYEIEFIDYNNFFVYAINHNYPELIDIILKICKNFGVIYKSDAHYSLCAYLICKKNNKAMKKYLDIFSVTIGTSLSSKTLLKVRKIDDVTDFDDNNFIFGLNEYKNMKEFLNHPNVKICDNISVVNVDFFINDFLTNTKIKIDDDIKFLFIPDRKKINKCVVM